ncbi:hypothetical protein ROA7450_02383 [Roseovarius albus]|uniref:Hedgehog/Intein (Hint) domain-containing protein n=1 Tax=Roseovarius albus TaxID=1247867 RepID=A0A1X6ZF21_9RHOB|nr:Hint domain-containing protein [Roseovarius albus]SLN47849.1 hypothetical protein ROA7450_02383 [Roseovarius albus]
MATYEINGWVWSGLGSATTLSTITITDDDPTMSPYFTDDFTETLEIGGTTYTNPRGGTYELTFTDSGGTSHTEDFLLWFTGSNFIFAPLPGSNFDDGSVLDSLGGWQEFSSGFNWEDITCFTSGTLIETINGSTPIETLCAGDLIKTQNHGYRPLLWIGKSFVSFADLSSENADKLYPVKIPAHSLGLGLPSRDLCVSRQHRMLVSSKIAARMFETSEVFVSAVKLLGYNGIRQITDLRSVEYYHLLFDQHEIIFAEDAPTESFYTGREALRLISQTSADEILKLKPEIAQSHYIPDVAAYIPSGKHQRKLIERHQKNSACLYNAATMRQERA